MVHVDRPRRSIRRRNLAAAVGMVAGLVLGACTDEQDPGLDQQIDVDDGSRPPSNTLGDCPPDGPDATTPAAGCLDDDGTVLRP